MSPARTAQQIYQELKATPKQVEIGGTTYYIVEGDLFLDDTQLFAYAHARAELEQAQEIGLQAQREGLVGITDDSGRIVRWRKGLVLTYVVQRDSFASQQQYDTVVRAMRQATASWEAICGVNFQHLRELDAHGAAAVGQALFRVMGYNTGGKFVAVAFFPYEPPPRRVIYIDPLFFDPNLTFPAVGVLRHELGHVLGFRHEHIRSGAPPVCPGEPLSHTVELTQYDPTSVMHYFCGDVGSKELDLTEVDRQGARLVYGPSDQIVTYCE